MIHLLIITMGSKSLNRAKSLKVKVGNFGLTFVMEENEICHNQELIIYPSFSLISLTTNFSLISCSVDYF